MLLSCTNFMKLFIIFVYVETNDGTENIMKSDKVKDQITVINKSCSPTPRLAETKRWLLDRVSPKQYELVNMIWRKTHFFIDGEPTSRSIKLTDSIKTRKKPIKTPAQNFIRHLTPLSINKAMTTPSYIEFYYSDFTNQRTKRISSDFFQKNQQNESKNIYYVNGENLERTDDAFHTPFLVFHVKYATYNAIKSSNPSTATLLPENNIFNANLTTAFARNSDYSQAAISIPSTSTDKSKSPSDFIKAPNITSLKAESNHIIDKVNLEDQHTLAYDKIKFFELYDNDTPKPYKIRTTDDIQNYNNEKLLFDVDYESRHRNNNNKTRYVKKHVDTKMFPHGYMNKLIELPSRDYFESLGTPNNISFMSRRASWSDFPFVAVYVYEPTQLRCEAAGISAHWLLASASCLSKHNENQYAFVQSAYVAYCSANWMKPERISYVKQKLIHPRFNAKDPTKQRLYNIGLIQIVNSMSETCKGWAPITLISHQYSTTHAGSLGVAVGWGLDRYDGNTDSNFDKYFLMWYQSLVYSTSCPGDIQYRKNQKNKVKNVYCLSLPNYTGENNELVHGALLLVGGKLIALYLQEERHPLGVQSAQYTGVWRLIPWLLKIAREPEESDPFPLEI